MSAFFVGDPPETHGPPPARGSMRPRRRPDTTASSRAWRQVGESSSVLIQLWVLGGSDAGTWLRVAVQDKQPGRCPLREGAQTTPNRGINAKGPVGTHGPMTQRLQSALDFAERGISTVYDPDLPNELLRYGVVYPGGWAATNLGDMLFPRRYVAQRWPLLDVLPSGAPLGFHHSELVWLSPVPSGSVTWVVEWPGEGVMETRTTLSKSFLEA